MLRRVNAPALIRPLVQDLRFARLASGSRIAWAVSGQGPPVVKVAHWMTHVEYDRVSPVWRPWLHGLGRNLRVLRYDERGCGHSGPDPTPPSLESALEELEVVMDAAGLARATLLGISGGAATAIAYAARRPERVEKLVLLGSYATGVARREPEHSPARMLNEGILRMIESAWQHPTRAVQRFMTTLMLPDASPEQAAAFDEQQLRSCGAEQAAAYLRTRMALDVADLLPRVACPTLVLHAEGDFVVPVELGRALAAAIPGAIFESLPTRNHVPVADEPAFERFLDRVAGFVGAPAVPASLHLTARDRELLTLVARGLDNLQIAAQLGLAEKTVRNALSRLYGVLAVEGRPQAIVRARDLGFS
jgi:pimeloyl-ACP methyl ester carboxylesterase